MSYVKRFAWAHYSTKLKSRILAQRASGLIEEGREGMRLVQATQGTIEEGSQATLYLLVDETNGEIIDAKYTAFGETSLIGALEVICELILKKNYDQARRISADLVDKHVQTSAKKNAFPPESYSHINFALSLLDAVLNLCTGIPLADGYVVTPVDLSSLEEGEYPNWSQLNEDQRLTLIRTVIERDIQPYIELDEGGVKITQLKGDLQVIIQYSGSCTSCYAATGSTLSAIQQILRKKVHPELVVTPDL